jgi:hypothetical protein
VDDRGRGVRLFSDNPNVAIVDLRYPVSKSRVIWRQPLDSTAGSSIVRQCCMYGDSRRRKARFLWTIRAVTAPF